MFDERIERALLAALDAHAGQVRRGTSDPYAVHPLHVALMLGRLGASSIVIQAGLLHDVVEDCDDWTEERVSAEFGAEVAAIVGELTEEKERSWEERKQAAIDSVPALSQGALVIKACDKLHNLRSLAASLRSAGTPHAVWSRFRGGRERTLLKSRLLVEALASRVEAGLAEALRESLEAVSRDGSPAS